jgi:hypothetical protein
LTPKDNHVAQVHFHDRSQRGEIDSVATAGWIPIDLPGLPVGHEWDKTVSILTN